MIEIESPLRPGTLQSLFEIASWVDSKLPPPRKPHCTGNYDFFPPILPDPKYAANGRFIRIRPTGRQVTIWEFCLNLYLLATPEQRELIKYKNYPFVRSYRQLQRLYLDLSYETIRKRYIAVLSCLCAKANRIGVKRLLR